MKKEPLSDNDLDGWDIFGKLETEEKKHAEAIEAVVADFAATEETSEASEFDGVDPEPVETPETIEPFDPVAIDNAKFNELAKAYLENYDRIRDLRKTGESILEALKPFAGRVYQDPSSTKCYRLERPSGKFIYYPELSLEKITDGEARELGFDVKVIRRSKAKEKTV